MTAMVLKGVRPFGGELTDLTLSDGVIVDPKSGPATVRRIDCEGLIALPGLVDLHTHLREPGQPESETVASGTSAAAAGGYTAVLAMANTSPACDTYDRARHVLELGARSGKCDVYPVGAVTAGLAGEQLAEIAQLATISEVRMFSDDGKCVSDSGVMRDALRAVRAAGRVLAQHAQDPLLTRGAQMNEGEVSAQLGLPGWPAMAEEAIIARDAIMARHIGARLHVCHVSTAGSVEVIRWAKSQGYPVTAEVTPHHLMLTDELARTRDATYKVNPPLRTEADVVSLRSALLDGTIDVVATDHAPHPAGAKRADWCDAPMGMLGLETALAVVAEATVEALDASWREVANWMSRRPAAIAGIESKHGGSLCPGSPATLCLVDPDASWSVDPDRFVSRSRNTPFIRRRLRHRVVATFLRGAATYSTL